MLDQALKTFEIVPDYDLNLMHPNQSLSILTANNLTILDTVITYVKPDWLLVQGENPTHAEVSNNLC
jgi:UDP-N-acetylglucosamine 2-epimerase (non-hydrolysing)